MSRKPPGFWPSLDQELTHKAYIDGVVASRGQNLVTNGSAMLGRNHNFSAMDYYGADHPVGAAGSFKPRVTTTTSPGTDEFIGVDPSKTYQFDFSIKQLTGDGARRFYSYVAPYDVDKLPIGPASYMEQANTRTTLAAPLNVGDTTITLTSSTGWNNAAGSSTWLRTVIVWNYVDGKGYAWPAGSYSRNYKADAYADGGISGNVITLKVPWAGQAAPAGTAVSNGSNGGSFMYGQNNVLAPTTWKAYSAQFSGVHTDNTLAATTKFPAATSYVKVGWLLNYPASPTDSTSVPLVSLVSFTDVTVQQRNYMLLQDLGPNIRHPDFGGIGNGVADDTAAFKAWRDARQNAPGASAIRGAPLIIPEGFWRLTDTIFMQDDSVHWEGSGWGNPTVGQPPQGTIFLWDGPAGIPMFKVQGGKGHTFRDFMAYGNPSAKPSAIFEMRVESSDTIKNGLCRFEKLVIGRLSGFRYSIGTRVAERGIYWNSVVDQQNDTSSIVQSRIEGCDVGWESNGTQQVLMHLAETAFAFNGTHMKIAADHTLDNVFFNDSSVVDLEITNGARVHAKYFCSENSYRMANLSGSGATLVIESGYWQMTNLARATEGDRIIFNNNDDLYTVLRLKDFQFTANGAYNPANRPIVRMKALTDSANAQKFIELDNVRYYVINPYQGVREDMFDIAPPAGSNATTTITGTVQAAPGGSPTSSNQGPRKTFFNVLKNGATPSFDRDDRQAVSTLTPYQFGATGPGLSVDNSAPLAALWAEAVSSGRAIHLPPGDWVTKTGNLPLVSSLIIKGSGRQKSRLRAGTGAASLFQWNTDISGVRIEDLYLDGASSTAHLFEPGASGGIHASVLKNLFMNQQVDGKAIWYQDNAASFIQVTIEDVEMQRTVGSTQIPFYIRNSGGGANSSQFRQVRLNGMNNVNTPFVHIESTLSQTFASDWQFLGVVGEQNPAGLIRMVSAAGVSMIGVTDQDATVAYSADVIRFEKNANNLAPRDLSLIGCTRRGSSLNAGVNEIWVDPAGKNVTLTACNPTPTSANATVSVPADTTMIQMRLDAVSATAFAWRANGGISFSVKDSLYGAKGDGTTTDTTAINACMTAARAARPFSTQRVRVIIPPGKYVVDNTINAAGLSVEAVGAVLQIKAGVTAFNVLQSFNDSMWVQGLTVDGNKANTTAPASLPGNGCGLYMHQASGGTLGVVRDVTIVNTHGPAIRASGTVVTDTTTLPYTPGLYVNITIDNCERGIWTPGTNGVTMRESRITNCISAGIWADNCRDITLDNNYIDTITGTDASCITSSYSYNLTATNNKCYRSKFAGIAMGGGSTTFPSTRGFTLANNKCENNYYHGITVDLAQVGVPNVSQLANGTITGNTCRLNGLSPANYGNGIYLKDAMDVTVTGNVCDGNYSNGISLNGKRLTANSNVCKNNGLYGIELRVLSDSVGDHGQYAVGPNTFFNNGALNAGGVHPKWDVFTQAYVSDSPVNLIGTGSPEGLYSGCIGSTFKRIDGTSGIVNYTKETGASLLTGWVSKSEMVSPGGTKYRLTVGDDGALTTTAV